MHPNYNFAPLNSHEPKDRSNSCFLRAKFCALQIVQSSCLGRAESDAGWAEEMSKTPLLNLESENSNIFYAIMCQTFWQIARHVTIKDVISKTLYCILCQETPLFWPNCQATLWNDPE